MSININVVNQKMLITSTFNKIVSGTQEFVEFRFNLSEDWDGLMPFAQFAQNGVAYNKYLNEDNSITLPSEIEAGTCTLMLYGSAGTKRATTNYITLKIDKDILVQDAQSTEITQSLYDQLVARVEFATSIEALSSAIEESVEAELAEYLESGKLTAMTIEDGSIARNKLDSDTQSSLDKADSALQEHQSLAGYATEDWVEDKGYLTEHQDISGKQDKTDNSLQTIDKTVVGGINEVNAIAKEAKKAKSSINYQALITELNSAAKTAYKVGQDFYIQTKNVPDLWVMSVENSSVTYTYTTDEQFITDTAAQGGCRVGYFKLAQLETQKVDISDKADIDDIPTKTSDLTNDSGFLLNYKIDFDGSKFYHNNIQLTYEQVAEAVINKNNYTFIIYDNCRYEVAYYKENNAHPTMPTIRFDYLEVNNTDKNIKGESLELVEIGSVSVIDGETIREVNYGVKRRPINITIPTKTSELTNNSGFLTSHQDISGKQDKTDNSLQTTSKDIAGAINELNSGKQKIIQRSGSWMANFDSDSHILGLIVQCIENFAGTITNTGDNGLPIASQVRYRMGYFYIWTGVRGVWRLTGTDVPEVKFSDYKKILRVDASGRWEAVNIVKNSYSATEGDVYDVRYINSMIGDINDELENRLAGE